MKRFTVPQKNIIVIVLAVISALNLAYQYYEYNTFKQSGIVKGTDFAVTSSHKIAEDINVLLDSVEQKTLQSVEELNKLSRYDNFDFEAYCEKKSYESEHLLGVTVSFEPYQRSAKDSLFSIYYDKGQGKSMRLDTIYDYTDLSQEKCKWYTEIVKTKTAAWTKPYYGAGAKNLITDYSAPLIKSGQVIGVITYTISISDLIDILHEISLGKGGFGFLITNDGTVITHPNSDLVLKQNMRAILNNDPIVDTVLQNSSGFVKEYFSPFRGTISFAFEDLANLQWKLITVFSPEDLFVNNDANNENVINLFLAGSLFIALLLLSIIFNKGITHSEAWTYSVFLTVLFIINIGFVWYRNLNNNFDSGTSYDVVVTGETSKNHYVTRHNVQRKQFGFPEITEVPTGVIIEKIKHLDTYNVGISGWIWQKYPDSAGIEPAIHFPQLAPFAEANLLEIVSEEKREGYLFVKWRFRSTFTFSFSYVEYPFNTKHVKLKICYPDYEKNVLFTPDIAGYPSLSPTSLPGIAKDSKTTASNYILSQFSFTDYPVVGALDSKMLSELKKIPVLQYEIKTRTPFLNALVKQIIPILLVSLMVFLLLFNLRHNKEGRKSIGVETIAGLLFILVLSHIDYRKTIFSPSITYLESFYFVIYTMIAFISVNIVIFDLNRDNLMTRDSNKFLKLSYWPFFFFSILVVTLIIFY